jgi:hypothetical protein
MATYDSITISGHDSNSGVPLYILEDLGGGIYQLLGSTNTASGLAGFGIAGGSWTFTTILPDNSYSFTNTDTGNAGDIFGVDAFGGSVFGVNSDP